ncbi:MAG: ATP-grasp domain-containing protein [Hellea sp.]|nr:ATP-grasp domain-containing protein [Hellea sp.]
MSSIKKILVANRGEIACRIMETAREMNIRTVAVYSDADINSMHVKMADEAVAIGPPPSKDSYLVIEKIIKATLDTGADAIHPGYGFLSENYIFAEACEEAGINFIGPSSESIRNMALKDRAKILMEKAGVPITPGYQGAKQEEEFLSLEADKIGFPVLIKAVAGGGGKGMRKVESKESFLSALESCKREAENSFGNPKVLLEKYIQSPRHIEVQIFGDGQGNVVHMFERDCSVQRRHQKVIEEAPAPGMTISVRDAMTDAAVKAAKAVNYKGAGTVEFIVDGSQKLRENGFWFMEMNTRLQVEHPVTEMITGLNLIKLQIEIAEGKKLPSQKNITMSGHAIETRIYAEDPFNNFFPSAGKIENFEIPSELSKKEGLRIDTGFQKNDRISIYYDPMIAKMIVHSDYRQDAIENMVSLISESKIKGIKTNTAFLIRCLLNDDFNYGGVSTHFINENIVTLTSNEYAIDNKVYGLTALFLDSINNKTQTTPFNIKNGWRLNQSFRKKYFFKEGENIIKTEIIEQNQRQSLISVNGLEPFIIFKKEKSNSKYNENALPFFSDWEFKEFQNHISLYRYGEEIIVGKERYQPNSLNNASNAIIAPMPGKIIDMFANEGNKIKEGEPLLVMEAMKMEMTLYAPKDGVIDEIKVQKGALVSDGDILVKLEDN